MKYLFWLVLNDGVCEEVTWTDPAEEAAVIDRCLIPITLGERGRATGGRDTPYTVDGVTGKKGAVLHLWDEEAPIADIGVCLHSRTARGLWSELHVGDVGGLTDINMPASAPWCAVRCYVPEAVLPPWFDSWTKTIGMALMRREGW